jgi:hypothetical protein
MRLPNPWPATGTAIRATGGLLLGRRRSGSLGAGRKFANPRFDSKSVSMFICGDDASAKFVTGQPTTKLGFDVVDASP